MEYCQALLWTTLNGSLRCQRGQNPSYARRSAHSGMAHRPIIELRIAFCSLSKRKKISLVLSADSIQSTRAICSRESKRHREVRTRCIIFCFFFFPKMITVRQTVTRRFSFPIFPLLTDQNAKHRKGVEFLEKTGGKCLKMQKERLRTRNFEEN